MTPAELACRWWGHEVKDLVVRTPKKRTRRGDLQFFVSQTCQRCGATREDRVVGDQPFHHTDARLQEGFNVLRAQKKQERAGR